MNSKFDRRKALKLGLGSAGALLFASPLPKAFASSCGLIPAQTEGPFFPGEEKFDHNNDLTFSGQTSRPQGQIIYVRGKVQDERCLPVPGAQIEIWQACGSGRYNNPADTNTAPLDPNFKYWGEAIADANGDYSFKTIIPGAYPADVDWIRPPHIHFKVECRGYHELITQMYFKGNTYNEADKILRRVPKALRGSVIVDFVESPMGFEVGSKTGIFDITIESVS